VGINGGLRSRDRLYILGIPVLPVEFLPSSPGLIVRPSLPSMSDDKKWQRRTCHRNSEFLFEKLDSARQRGLRHIALLTCAREIQLLGHCEEITNLVHFHDDLTGMVDGHGSIWGTLLTNTLLSMFAVRLASLGIAEPSALLGEAIGFIGQAVGGAPTPAD
jgi:hypothetical protein